MLVSLGVLIVMLRLKDIIDIVQRVQGGQFEHVGKTPQSSYKKLAIKSKLKKNQNI